MIGMFLTPSNSIATDVPWGRLRLLSAPATSASQKLVVIEGAIHPGSGHDFHHHPNQDEVIYILHGKIEQWLGEESRILVPGDGAFIPAGMVHASFAVDGPATLLAILGPSVGDGVEQVDVSGDQPWNRLRQPR